MTYNHFRLQYASISNVEGNLRLHHGFETGVSVALQKGLVYSKKFFEKISI